MEQKKTIILYDSENMGQMRSISFSAKQLKIYLIVTSILIALSLICFTILINFTLERSTFLHWRAESKRLKSQIKVYQPLIESLESKSITLDTVKERLLKIDTITNDVVHNHDNITLETSVIDDLSVSIYKKHALTDILTNLDSELDIRIDSISKLANVLEEYEFLLQSTPSGSPVSGRISSNFDFRYSPFNGRLVFHEGIDIAAPHGTPISSSAKGIVIFAGYKAGYGFLVTVDHGYGFVTRYAHNSAVLVREGDYVQRGEKIALVGSTGHSTGPHLHYEVLLNGVPVNPINFIRKISESESTERVSAIKKEF